VQHNWADARLHPVAAAENSLRRAWFPSDPFVVEYSGNFGRAHEARTLVSAIEKLREDPAIAFLFVGGGAQLQSIRDGAKANVRFEPYQPIERLSESLSAGDLHIVTLRHEMEGLIVPSKFYGILAVGRPVLFVGAPDGELAAMIDGIGCGGVVAEGDVEGLVGWIRRLAGDRTGQRRWAVVVAKSTCATSLRRLPCETGKRFLMPDRQSRWGLPAIALLMIAAATVALTVAPPASDPPLPSDSAVLASRLAAHPTDWLATCALTERALDSSSPQRFALWHAAHAHAQLLAPNRPEPQEAFARSGFFHWNELSATDRQAVLAAEEPLLRNPPTFFSMARPLFELTGAWRCCGGASRTRTSRSTS
jgi:Glycosyltransferase